MGRRCLSALALTAVTLQGFLLMAAAQVPVTLPKAGGSYIIEATNATFVDANTLVLSGPSPITTFRITYPYKDAGVLDTASLVTNPIYSPNGAWLGGPIGTIFGNAPNATALLLVINGQPVLDVVANTLAFNVSIISDPQYLKFQDGVARLTYDHAVTPNAFAKTVTVTAQVGPGAVLTGAALFLDVDQTLVVPASIPPAAAPISAGITNNNNNGGGVINNNNNGGGNTVPTAGVITTNNNNNAGGTGATSAGGITNNNNNGVGGTTTTNNNGSGPGTSITNNNNNGGATPVPSAPGQTPAPGTYNVITTTTDCNGQTTVQYSYVPGLRGISRNNNNNCG